MDSLNNNSEAIIAIAAAMQMIITGVLMGITYYYVQVTKKILEENRQMRLDAEKPRIAIYPQWELTREEGRPEIPALYLSVENIGMGPAYELEFTTEDFFQLPDNELVGEIGFIQYGMRYLAPRQKNKHRLGRIWSKGKSIYKLIEEQLQITVTYKDLRNKEYSERFCLNFQEYKSGLP